MSYFEPPDPPEWSDGGQDWWCWKCNKRIGDCECEKKDHHVYVQYTVCPNCREEMIDAEVFIDAHVSKPCEPYYSDYYD
jgi:hypothetical protein